MCMNKINENKWFALASDAVLKQLNTNTTEGLSTPEITTRQQTYGKNLLPEKKKQSAIIKFLKHFNDILIYVLFAAAIITFFLEHYLDTVVIMIVAFINASIGFFQENKAEKALEDIKKMLSHKAQVIRNGKRLEIDAAELTIGDIVFLSPGDKVPADLRIIKADNLRIEESPLTGESVPSEKRIEPLAEDTMLGDRINMAFSSTTVRAGTGVGVVVAIGENTEIGKINQMMSDIEDITTPLLKQTAQFGKMVSAVILVGSALIFAFGYFFRSDCYAPQELLLSVIGLAIAVIPEGLPAILSIILAIGVQNMAKRNSIVRTLPSVETLGSVSVICSDKTGTLTKNEMTVKTLETRDGEYFVTGAGYAPVGKIYHNSNNIDCRRDPEVCECCKEVDFIKEPVLQELIEAFYICNEAVLSKDEDSHWMIAGDPTEGSLITLYHKAVCMDIEDAACKHHGFEESIMINALSKEESCLTKGCHTALDAVSPSDTVEYTEIPHQVRYDSINNNNKDINHSSLNTNHSNRNRRISTIPFDSEYKYMATLIERDDHNVIVIKGAPDKLMDMSQYEKSDTNIEPFVREHWERQITAIAVRGQRTIGAAYKMIDKSITEIDHSHIQDGIIFLGLAGIIDPPREEAIASVAKCKEAGITVKMITGDHIDTARTIAKELGIGLKTIRNEKLEIRNDGNSVKGVCHTPLQGPIVGAYGIRPNNTTDINHLSLNTNHCEVKALQGKDLEKMTDEELAEAVLDCDVFARTSPEHKLRLVRALQSKGITCAMTGDGVNDAPALRKADVGIAMGIKGTEVTKDAAEIVLADDNFSTIVAAVEEGRRVYDNLKKTILFILPTNGAEGFLIMASILFGTIMPLIPVQILWVNMVTSITISLALAFELIEPNAMKRPPRSPKTPLLSGYFIWRIFFVSVLIGGWTLWLNIYLLDAGFSIELVRTITLQTIVIAQMFHLFNSRSVRGSAFSYASRNKAVFYVCGLLFVLQFAITYLPFMNVAFGTVPLDLSAWKYPFLLGIAVFLIVELEKAIMRKIDKMKGRTAVF